MFNGYPTLGHPNRRAAVTALFQEGKSVAEIAALIGVTASNVHSCLHEGRKSGVLPPTTGRNKQVGEFPSITAACESLTKEGLSTKEISERLGVSFSVVATQVSVLRKKGRVAPKPRRLMQRLILSAETLAKLEQLAGDRGIAPGELAAKLIEAVLSDAPLGEVPQPAAKVALPMPILRVAPTMPVSRSPVAPSRFDMVERGQAAFCNQCDQLRTADQVAVCRSNWCSLKKGQRNAG